MMTKATRNFQVILAAAFICLMGNVPQAGGATIDGELVKWHPVTVSFTGPLADETDDSPNPFLDYRLVVTFTGPSGKAYSVPGFFDGDGLGGGFGNIWRVRFAPDEAGIWDFQASFRAGNDIAVDLSPEPGAPVAFDGEADSFVVAPLDGSAPGFLKWGRLEYVGSHYLKFRNGPFWLKGGVDSPENFLGYAGFDNTVNHATGSRKKGLTDGLHRYGPHIDHWTDGDPNFISVETGYDGKGIIGALNYLASESVNSIYFLPMNLGGDGRDTYPFVAPGDNAYDKTHYDISKLHQWNLVLDQAQRRGIAAQFVLAETESGNENWFDGGTLGVERKLFYRELIARYSYLLAVKWNLSEENDFSDDAVRAFADFIGALDWAEHQMTFHTHVDNINEYLPHLGDIRFDATSIQYTAGQAGTHVESMRTDSANQGRPLVIDMDENAPSRTGLTATNAADLRKQALYDVYLSGGNIEWYFGNHRLPLGGDLRTEDFSTRAEMYLYMRNARAFIQENLPFWNMEPGDALLVGEDTDFGGGEVFYKEGEVYAVYLPDANPSGSLELGPGDYIKRWFNPRTGIFEGDTTQVSGGTVVALGEPPRDSEEDWVLLLSTTGNMTPSASFISPTPGAVLEAPGNLHVQMQADDFDGTIGSVELYLDGNPVGTDMIAPYQWGPENPLLSDLAPGSYELKVVVTDQLGSQGDARTTVVIGQSINTEPTVAITEPADGSIFLNDVPVTFSGVGNDVEDGDLSSALSWESNLDGPIGVGASISAVLSIGSHTITALVTDSGGISDSDTISVAVTTQPGVNTPPVADDQNVTTARNKSVTINLTASDGDGDPLTFIVLTQPSHGKLSGEAPDLVYKPDKRYTGPDSFTFQAHDGLAVSNVASISIDVTTRGR